MEMNETANSTAEAALFAFDYTPNTYNFARETYDYPHNTYEFASNSNSDLDQCSDTDSSLPTQEETLHQIQMTNTPKTTESVMNVNIIQDRNIILKDLDSRLQGLGLDWVDSPVLEQDDPMESIHSSRSSPRSHHLQVDLNDENEANSVGLPVLIDEPNSLVASEPRIKPKSKKD